MTPNEMLDVLDRLGIEVESVNGDEITAHCPAHKDRVGKEDANPSWFINAHSGKHICFSCHFKGGLNTLIKYSAGEDYEDVGEWLNLGERNLGKRFARLSAPPIEDVKPAFEVTESMLRAFTTPPVSALRSRGLTAEACAQYGVYWNESNESWVLAFRDALTNELMGWQEKLTTQKRFYNHPTGVSKSHIIFGYDQYKSGDMVVMESPLDVVRLASLGISGGVAVCGASISYTQVNLLRGADRLIMAMDNDEAGHKASEAMLNFSNIAGFECWFFNYSQTDKKDIGGMSKSEVLFGLQNARHGLHGKKALT